MRAKSVTAGAGVPWRLCAHGTPVPAAFHVAQQHTHRQRYDNIRAMMRLLSHSFVVCLDARGTHDRARAHSPTALQGFAKQHAPLQIWLEISMVISTAKSVAPERGRPERALDPRPHCHCFLTTRRLAFLSRAEGCTNNQVLISSRQILVVVARAARARAQQPCALGGQACGACATRAIQICTPAQLTSI